MNLALDPAFDELLAGSYSRLGVGRWFRPSTTMHWLRAGSMKKRLSASWGITWTLTRTFIIERLPFCGNPQISGTDRKALWTVKRRACRNQGLGFVCAGEAFPAGDKADFFQVQGNDSKAWTVSDSPYLYLTVSQIQELHDAVIEVQGGTRGAENGEGLDSCVDAPQNVAFLKEGDVFEQASAYACSILRKSPFKDGNRGTALAAVLVFLDINGVMDLDYDDSLLVQAMLYLAEGKLDGNLFAEFLREAISGVTGTWQDESQSR